MQQPNENVGVASEDFPPDAIAIVGMAGRFPGAPDIATFWENLQQGLESITHFTEEQLRAIGVPEQSLADPHFVRAGAVLPDIDVFDAGFFGYSPREAALTDPQHRLFLECAWSAFEDAALVPDEDQKVGVYAGSGLNTYLIANVLSQPGVIADTGMLPLAIANKSDFMPSKLSYRLGLTGPSVNVNTACSTSLVATHMAVRALQGYECDVAVAGGVTVDLSAGLGYHYQAGGVSSATGHCRAFDAKADGTVCGSGVGAVVMMRLEDALAGGFHMYAIVRGSAINNDGNHKVGYAAPGVAGQRDVIASALAVAEVNPASIGYVEAHGTGTVVGDPIEVRALTEAFQMDASARQYCALGSVKANIGHLDTAAGVASLIKASLCLHHRELVPSIGYDTPNPAIDFASTPFFVNSQWRTWQKDGGPRRAGVSSFGIGGTNAHVVLEEAPVAPPVTPAIRNWQLLTLSARSPAALARMADKLADHLAASMAKGAEGHASLADISFTLQQGRRSFKHRRALVVSSGEQAVAALRHGEPDAIDVSGHATEGRRVVFLLPGIGDQHVGMGRELYRDEPLFRDIVDDAAALLNPLLGRDLRELMGVDRDVASAAPALDLRALLRGTREKADPAEETLRRTRFAHPALFVLEYATARLMMSWGVQPAALIGHSLGEYVAACLAGVMSFADALTVVAQRAALIDALPTGRMLAVAASAEVIGAILPPGLSLAADNAPKAVVVAGSAENVERFSELLRDRGIVYLPVASDHAFHSICLEPIREGLERLLKGVTLSAPSIPCLSNVTGQWLSAQEATDPARWAEHSCATVAFRAGIETLRAAGHDLFVEIGAGQSLSAFVQQSNDPAGSQASDTPLMAVPTLPGRHATSSATEALAGAAATLWCVDAWRDTRALHAAEKRRRVSLPAYPFERQRHWIEPQPVSGFPAAPSTKPTAEGSLAPSAPASQTARWTQAAGMWPSPVCRTPQCWLVFLDDSPLGQALCDRLRDMGQTVVSVRPGRAFAQTAAFDFNVEPGSIAHHASLARALKQAHVWPDRVVHLWGLITPQEDEDSPHALALGYASVLAWARAFGSDARSPMAVLVASEGVHSIDGSEILVPDRAAVLGPCRVLPLEMPHLSVAHVDLRRPGARQDIERTVNALLNEHMRGLPDGQFAIRGTWRWTLVRSALPSAISPMGADLPALLPGSRALVVNYGMDRIGRVLAEDFVCRTGGSLDIVVDIPLPAEDDWERVAHATETPAALRHVLGDLLRLRARAAALNWTVCTNAEHAELGKLGTWLAGRGRPDLVLHVLAMPLPQLISTQEGGVAPELQLALERGAVVCEALARPGFGAALFIASHGAAIGQVGLAAAGAAEAAIASLSERLRTCADGPFVQITVDLRETSEMPGTSMLARRLLDARALGALDDDALRDAWPKWVQSGEARLDIAAGDPAAVRASLRQQTLAALTAQAPDAVSLGMRAAHEPPSDEIEEGVASLWEDLFGIYPIGRQDHFFALGGSSLLAVQFVARLRERYAVEMDLAALFRSPTVAGVAKALEALLMAEIEALDDEELARQLAAQSQGSPEAPHVEPVDLRLPDNLLIRQFNRAETEHFYNDIFVERVYCSHGVTLRPDALVFDVGANVGLFSLFIHRECRGARIIAFEPAPAVFAALQANLLAHGVNAEALNCGVGARSGRRSFTFYPLSTGMSSFHANIGEEKDVLHAIMRNQWQRGEQGMDAVMDHVDDLLERRFSSESVECEVRTLSDIIDARGVARIDLLKIDVQKSELEVLEGLEARHWPLVQQIVIEVHDIDGRVGHIDRLLRAHGFRVSVQQEILYERSNISILYGLRPESTL